MKTLKDTIDGMLSDDWKVRLVAELEQLDIRIFHLEKHIQKLGEDSPEISLLQVQLDSMKKYRDALMARATVFDIEFKLPSIPERAKEDCCCCRLMVPDDSIDPISALIIGYMLGGSK